MWIGERKIASLGVHVSRGISTHGFAVNVENDLEPFGWVVACGLPDVQMTSLAAETQGAGERHRLLPQADGLRVLPARTARASASSPRTARYRRAKIPSGGPPGPEPPKLAQAVPA